MSSNIRLKIGSVIIIGCLLILLVILAAVYIDCQTRQPQIIYRTSPRPNAYIVYQRGYSIDQNTFNTTIIIENQGTSGIIMVEYLSLKYSYDTPPGILERKEYYVRNEERKAIVEIWQVSDDYYVVCNIIYQGVAE